MIKNKRLLSIVICIFTLMTLSGCHIDEDQTIRYKINGEIVSKNERTVGVFDTKEYYIKVKLYNENTLVQKVNYKDFINCETNDKVYVILNESKSRIIKTFQSEENLNDYIKQNEESFNIIYKEM